MTHDAFLKHAHSESAPLSSWSMSMQALWWSAKGDWHQAHELCQVEGNAEGDWVHAYLHREEGDLGNAAYWYRRANKSVCDSSLEAEHRAIYAALAQNA